jgi:signal transduction histidine kinase
MTSASARRIAWSVVAVGWALVVGAAVLLAWAGGPAPGAPDVVGPIFGPADTLVLGILLCGLFGGTGALIVSRFPSNLLGWTFTLGVLMVSTVLAGMSYGYAGLVARPGALPAARLVQVLFGDAMWLPIVSIQVVALLLLFPDGRLNSPGRRWTLWTGLAGAMLGAIGTILGPRMYGIDLPNPLAVRPAWIGELIGSIGIALVLGAAIAAAVSLVRRFRRSLGEERQQMKWFVYAAGLMFVVQIALNAFVTAPAWLTTIAAIATALVPVAVGVAILKYRLYDIDIVIRKTVVYAVLAGLIFVVGAGLVRLATGVLVGGRGGDALLLAGILIGLLVWPLRRVALRIADRLVFGGRASPYELLTEFSGRMGEHFSADDVLPRMAEILARGTGAVGATVWLTVEDEMRPAATWPLGSDRHDGDRFRVDVVDRGEVLGALSVETAANDPLDGARQRSVRDLAAQAGLALRNVRLIEELRDSRRRIVAAQDERAKKLERNIHDGAQQQLVALAVKQRLAASLIGKDDDQARALQEELQAETAQALEDLRDLARGIYPPLLADKGLDAALESQVRRSSVPVAIESDGVGRFPAETESAVYFSVLESLQNVAKYAQASRVIVRMAQANGTLSFEVIDDGIGFDPAVTGHGSGLQGIADRLAALGGELDVTSAPGEGTTVAARLPIGGDAH